LGDALGLKAITPGGVPGVIVLIINYMIKGN